MATIVTNANAHEQTGMRKYWTYNAFDCTVTREVYDVLEPRLTDVTRRTYKFEMACQSPAFAMMLRGVQVDEGARQKALASLKDEFAAATARLQPLVAPYWTEKDLETGTCPQNNGKKHRWPKGEPDETRVCKLCGTPRMKIKEFNPLSDDQGKKLFYRDIGIKEMMNKKGIVSVDKEVLDRIENKYEEYRDITRAIKECRTIWKDVSVLNTALSPDGRMRSTFVVGGPETGRWSSTDNPYGDGTNLQNIAEKLRYIFVRDPGRRLFYADLEQAESCTVAHLAQDEGYIAAHKSGDVHTFVARIMWPDLPWNGDLKKDKAIAEELHPEWDPEHSFRYNAKRLQHGSNYLLSAAGVARLAHIPIRAAAAAQGRYFDYFPGIRNWHIATNGQLKETGVITTPLGRQRQFFGRNWDGHTIKQAVAFVPQSMVADILNTALWHVWKNMDPDRLWLLAQVHDAIFGSVEEVNGVGDEEAIEALLTYMKVPVIIHGREMVIATDCKLGVNWGKFSEKNPGGMR